MSYDILNDVGPGWRPLIKPLLALCEKHGVQVTQIKEKYGTLRFYTSGAPKEVEEAVEAAELLSGITCEECGEYGTLRGTGWFKTCCEKHHAERDARRAGTKA